MSRLLLTLLPLLFGCGKKETAASGNPLPAEETVTPEYHRDNGAQRIYVDTPTKGKAVMRYRQYVGDSIASVYVVELTDCVVFSPETWRCDNGEVSKISVDAGALTVTSSDGNAKLIHTRVRP
jgi:hypothetical protein